MDHFFRAISIFAGRVGLETMIIRARAQVRPGKVHRLIAALGFLSHRSLWLVVVVVGLGCIQHLAWYGRLSPIVIIANCLIISKTFFTALTDNLVGRGFIENMENISNVFLKQIVVKL